jgi:hypothetical protein
MLGPKNRQSEHASFRMRATASGLIEVGHTGPYRMRAGVKEEGIQVRKPIAAGQKGGEQK